MPEPLTVGDIHKGLKAQAKASQRIYETVVELANIAHAANANLGGALNKRLDQVIRELSDVADSLSYNIDEVTQHVLKSLKSLESAGPSGG